MGLLISLIVFLIVIGLAFWVVSALAGAFGIPAPIVTVIQIILVVMCVVYLLSLLSGGLPAFRFGR